MVESGDWLTPHFNYEPRFQKPALYYWLAAVVYLVTGPSEFAARLWSALAAVGLVLITAASGGAGSTSAPAWSRERSLPPTSAISRWRAWRCPTCRSRSSSRWRSGRRLSRRSSASAIPPLAAAGGGGRGARLSDEGPARAGHSGAGRRADPDDRAAIVQRAVFRRAARGCSFSRLRRPGMSRCGCATAASTSRASSSATTSSGSRRRASTTHGRGGSTCRCSPAACCRGRRLRSCGSARWCSFVTRRRDVGTVDLRLLFWVVLPLVVLHVVGRQAAALRAAGAAAAGAAARKLHHRADQRVAQSGRHARPASSQSRRGRGCVLAGLFLIALAVLLYRAQPLFLNVPDSTRWSWPVSSALPALRRRGQLHPRVARGSGGAGAWRRP